MRRVRELCSVLIQGWAAKHEYGRRVASRTLQVALHQTCLIQWLSFRLAFAVGKLRRPHQPVRRLNLEMRFHTSDLLSKWGFDDGDLIENFLETHEYPTHIIDLSPLWQKIFTQHVVPTIQNSIEFEWIPSLHNGARAKTVDGQLIDHTVTEHPDINIRPSYVDVSDDDVLQMAMVLRDCFMDMSRDEIVAGMKSGNNCEVESAFTAMQLHGIREEDHDIIAATCSDERVDEGTRRRIQIHLKLLSLYSSRNDA